MEEPTVGKKFGSFQEWSDFLSKYQKDVRQVFTKSHSTKLSGVHLKGEVNGSLEYYNLQYGCKAGGSGYRPKNSGQRRTSTYKKGFPAFIKLHIASDRQCLKITQLQLLHENHDDSQVFFEYLPENRRLPPEAKKMVIDILKLQCNKKLLQNKIHEEYGIFTTLKDLSNIKSTLLNGKDNSFGEVIEYLKRIGVEPHVLVEENCTGNSGDHFKGLYFSSDDMRKSMKAWPEIVLLDGTYKLYNNDLTLMILMVVDSNGRVEVVGFALIVTEDRPIFEWFLKKFKDENKEACNNINCFMSDKDLPERDILKEVFPGTAVYICMFHTLKTFKYIVSTNKNLSMKQKNDSLIYLERLAKNSSQDDYNQNYTEFTELVPESIVNYFNKNWHPIQSEWTRFNMVHGNLNNQTNNRLESTNGKIKQVVEKNSSLLKCVQSLFAWLKSHNFENDVRTSVNFTKQQTFQFASDSCEYKYMMYLTREGFSQVYEEIKKLKNVRFVEDNEPGHDLCVKSSGGLLTVTDSSCNCPKRTSSLLPCRHIFAARRKLALPLYAENLCNERWTKMYCKDSQRSFRQSNTHDTEHVSISLDISKHAPLATRTTYDRKKKIAGIISDLVNVVSVSADVYFENKLEEIRKMQEILAQGQGVILEKEDQQRRSVGGNPQNVTQSSNFLQKRKIVQPIIRKLSETVLSQTGLQFDNCFELLKKLQSFCRKGYYITVASNDLSKSVVLNTAKISRLTLEADETIKMPDRVLVRGRPSLGLNTTIRYAKVKRL